MTHFATTLRTALPLAWDHAGKPTLFWQAPPDRTTPVQFGLSLEADGSVHQCPMRSWRNDSLGWRSSWGWLHNLGVHAYQRAISAKVREVVVQIDNATTDLVTFDGSLYFSRLTFSFPKPWKALSIERPDVGDSPQFFPSLAYMTWRVVLYRGRGTQLAAMDARDMLHCTPDFEIKLGPSRTSVLRDQRLEPRYAILSALASGAKNVGTDEVPGFYTTNLGLWHPISDQQAGAVAGSGIYPFPKLGDPLYHALRSDCLMERNRIGGYDAENGKVIEAHRYAPQDYRLYRGSTWNQRLRIYSGPTVHDQWTEPFANSGVCGYETQIRNRKDEFGYSALDVAHMIRGYLDDVAAYVLTGCPLHRDRLMLFAQDVMASERQEFTGPVDQPWNYSLAQRIRDAERAPGRGTDILRSEGWKMHVVALTIAYTPPGEARNRMQSWGRDYLKLQALVSTTHGVPRLGTKDGNDDSGIPWNDEGLAENKQEAPTFQCGIYFAGLDELSLAVTGTHSEIAARSADAVFFGSVPFVKSEYADPSEGENYAVGPPWYLVTGVDGVPGNPITEGVGESHTLHLRDWLARAYSYMSNPKYFDAACTVDYRQPNVEALRNAVRDTKDPWLFAIRHQLLGMTNR